MLPERHTFAQIMAQPFPRLAFHYGPSDADLGLDAYQVVIVEAGHGFQPRAAQAPGTLWLAYLSMGEILAGSNGFDDMPRDWRMQRNGAWGGWIIDQTAAGWSDFLVQRLAGPLWQAGYHGFFLDTMDSYHLVAGPQAERERQGQGLAAAVAHLRAQFPKAVIIPNRGFELLSAIGGQIDAVAFESLYQGWNESTRHYVTVPQADRDWLLDRAAAARQQGLPVIAIDYRPAHDFGSAPALMRRIASHGIAPYVGDNYLHQRVPLHAIPAEA